MIWEGFYYPPSDEGAIYGDMIAGLDFIDALLEYGDYDKHHLFTVNPTGRPNQPAEIAQFQQRFKGHAGIDLRSHTEAFHLPAAPKTIFHEIWRHQYWAAHYLRNLRQGPVYPITRTSHSSWYQADGYYFSLMNGAVYPFDSIVCSSGPARDVTLSLMETTAERVSRSIGRDMRYPGRVDMIPLGIDTEKFCPRDQGEVRRQFGIDEDEFIILWIGRVSALSKADLIPLLPVIARVIERHPDDNIFFYIAGRPEQPYGTRLSALLEPFGVAGRVKFIQDVPPDRRHLIYNVADIFVSPVDHVQECFGLTPLEALSSGIPQIVSEWDGYRDTVVHGKTGFLVPTYLPAEDAERSVIALLNEAMWLPEEFDGFALAQNITVDMEAYEHFLNLLVEDNELRAKMAASSRARALEIYPWKNIIGRYCELWDELRNQASSFDRSTKPDSQAYEYRRARWESGFYSPFATHLLTNDTLFLKGKLDFSRLEAKLDLLPAVELYVIDKDLARRTYDAVEQSPTRACEITERLRSDGPAAVFRALTWLTKMGCLKVVLPDRPVDDQT